jgi:hypothetical protein
VLQPGRHEVRELDVRASEARQWPAVKSQRGKQVGMWLGGGTW